MRFFLLLLLCAFGGARAAEVQVAVAANFAAPMQKIAAAFARETGHKALLAIGSTGRFYAQVKSGAPFQVLLAADEETPARLAAEGLAVGASRFTYATGRLVLWSAQAGLVDPEGQVLRAGGFERLAIADPRLAPYGAAAMEVITRMELPRGVIGRIVQGESVAQAFQFVVTGNAQLGFVALSQVMADGRMAKGSAWVVPATMHKPIRQDAILLNQGQGNAAAAALLQFLRGDAARALLRAHGYEP